MSDRRLQVHFNIGHNDTLVNVQTAELPSLSRVAVFRDPFVRGELSVEELKSVARRGSLFSSCTMLLSHLLRARSHRLMFRPAVGPKLLREAQVLGQE